MKKVTVLCLVALAVASLPNSAEAGRRAVRRAARISTTAVAAAAIAPRRSTTVVAAAPVVVAAPQAAAVALPDLTVTDLKSERDALVITVKNIGRAPSPLTHLAIELRRPNGLLVGAHASRVLPLAVNQSVQIRVHSAPLDDVHVLAVADPLDEVAEMSELNNNRAMALAPLPVTPPMLQDEAQWPQPASQGGETIAPGTPM